MKSSQCCSIVIVPRLQVIEYYGNAFFWVDLSEKSGNTYLVLTYVTRFITNDEILRWIEVDMLSQAALSGLVPCFSLVRNIFTPENSY